MKAARKNQFVVCKFAFDFQNCWLVKKNGWNNLPLKLCVRVQGDFHIQRMTHSESLAWCNFVYFDIFSSVFATPALRLERCVCVYVGASARTNLDVLVSMLAIFFLQSRESDSECKASHCDCKQNGRLDVNCDNRDWAIIQRRRISLLMNKTWIFSAFQVWRLLLRN